MCIVWGAHSLRYAQRRSPYSAYSSRQNGPSAGLWRYEISGTKFNPVRNCWKYEFQQLPSREGAHQQYFDLYQKKSDTVSNNQYQMLPSHLPHTSSEGTMIANPNYIQSAVLFENPHRQQLCFTSESKYLETRYTGSEQNSRKRSD